MLDRITRLDRRVTQGVLKIHNKVLDKIMLFFTYIGVAGIVWFLMIIPFIFLKDYRNIGVVMLISLGVNYILSEILIKHIVGRKRPSTYIDQDDLLVNKPKDPSFPSGHSSSAFSAFAVLFFLAPKFIWIPALFVALLIAFSRIYLQVHYLSDVVCGIIFGFCVGSTITAFYARFFI